MRRDELIEVLGTYDPPAGHRIDTIVVVTDHWIMVTTSADGEHTQQERGSMSCRVVSQRRLYQA